MAAQVTSLAADMLQESYLLSHADTPFPAHLHAPVPSQVLVITGENASGKSVAFQILASSLRAQGALPITVSIRERTGAGLSEMAGMRKVMMFGDEAEQSTGATSVSAAQMGIQNLRRRCEEGAAALLLDEPEMGLSEAYAAAMGAWLGQEALQLPSSAGLIIVTHSRPLVQQLFAQAPQAGFLYMGPGPLSPQQWLNKPEQHTPEELLSLVETGHARRQAVHALLRSRPEPRRTAPPLKPRKPSA